MKRKLAVFDNEFLRSSYLLNLTEKRVLWTVVSKVKHSKDLTPETWLEVSLVEFAELIGIVPKKAYFEARQAVLSIKRKEFSLHFGKSIIVCNFFSEIMINEDEKTIKARISPSFIPFISELYEKYNKMNLLECFKIRSIYTWRFYDIFRTLDGQLQHRKYPVITLSLEELYNITQAKDSYRTFGEFNKHIIKPMVRELEFLEIARVKVSPIKKGRVTEKLKFTVIWWKFIAREIEDEINIAEMEKLG